jgi:membrane-associated protein
MDPNWLLDQFGSAFIWVSGFIVFVECGLFFPFLPGDTLLFAIGLFISNGALDFNLPVVVIMLIIAAFAGNVVGYEIGRAVGGPLRHRDGRVIKRKYFDQTEAFFDRYGNRALVLGRFVPFVRTYITIVAGIGRMERHRFFLWSAIGAILWVLSITLLGYFLGETFPALQDNIDLAIIIIVALTLVPIVVEWYRHRRRSAGELDEASLDESTDANEPSGS